jgi:hypothetical protein
MHGLLMAGLSSEEITPPNGNSSEWERRVFGDVSSVPDKAKRVQIFNQYIVNMPERQKLQELIFNPPSRKGIVEYIGSKAEKAFKSANYVDVLARLGYEFRQCDLDDSIEVNHQVISDTIEAEIRARARDIGLNKLQYMRDAYISEAAKNHYNPILDYFESLSWDGIDWIETLACHLVDENDIMPIILRRWLIGAVARNYQETQNRMLVLDGPQGIGKSRFVAWLASPLVSFFHEGDIRTDDKDFKIYLSNTWIWEVSELGSTIKRSDIEALKSFLTTARVKVRPAFAKNTIDKKAITSFIGTVNNIGGVLNDASGSRRFMATTLTHIDFDYVKIDINQVWAQAVALYKKGEPWAIEGDERVLIDQANEKYETENPVIDMIVKSFELVPGEETAFVPTSRMIEILHDNGWGSHNPVGEAMIISTACKKIGVKKAYQVVNGILCRGYCGLRARINQP